MFTYNDMSGRPDLKKAVAQFFTDQTKSPSPVDPSKVRTQDQPKTHNFCPAL